jgi:hypothetical protein
VTFLARIGFVRPRHILANFEVLEHDDVLLSSFCQNAGLSRRLGPRILERGLPDLEHGTAQIRNGASRVGKRGARERAVAVSVRLVLAAARSVRSAFEVSALIQRAVRVAMCQ